MPNSCPFCEQPDAESLSGGREWRRGANWRKEAAVHLSVQRDLGAGGIRKGGGEFQGSTWPATLYPYFRQSTGILCWESSQARASQGTPGLPGSLPPESAVPCPELPTVGPTPEPGAETRGGAPRGWLSHPSFWSPSETGAYKTALLPFFSCAEASLKLGP